MHEESINESIEELSKALAKTSDPELILDFFKSLFTDNEFKEIGSRWALVRLINQGYSQRKIADMLGLSLCKITRGSKELKKENSSFRQMLDIYNSEET